MTDKPQMPDEIWAAQDSSGSTYWLNEDHPAIDRKPHAKGRNQTRYVRADLAPSTTDRGLALDALNDLWNFWTRPYDRNDKRFYALFNTVKTALASPPCVDVDLTQEWPEPPSIEYALYVATHSEQQNRQCAKDWPKKSLYYHGAANAFEVMKGVIQEAIEALRPSDAPADVGKLKEECKEALVRHGVKTVSDKRLAWEGLIGATIDYLASRNLIRTAPIVGGE